MAKAINWPASLREDVLSEDCDALHTAFRLGRLYFENQFWVPEEVVDIRVNHLRIRKGVVRGELKLCKIGEITPEDLGRHKRPAQTAEALAQYLAETYQQTVTLNTDVTIVTYQNLPVVPEEIEG